LSPSPPAEAASGSPRALLARYGLSAKKSWGQNFLVDRRTQQRIVAAAAIAPEDTVMEIGAGLGALTQHLVTMAGRVIAVERDPDMVQVLRGEFAARANLDIAAMDALDVDFATMAGGRPLIVIGNLPYQITTPLLFAITGAAARGQVVSRAVLMVQREFAERVVAGPGSKIYGRLSVMVQQQAAVEILFHVGPGAFHPRPSVTSSVFRLVPRVQPLAPVRDDRMFAAVVRAAFATRRKMLRRALAPLWGEQVGPALARAGIDETRRAEELDVAAFARLADAIVEEGGAAPVDHA
jgi:16S rRNA (adenine1518-N6/adenine1519-N6)-dimethyltransferase